MGRPDVTPETIIPIAVYEYLLDHAVEDAAERRGRRAAVRGMMVRLKLYLEFCEAVEAEKLKRSQ